MFFPETAAHLAVRERNDEEGRDEERRPGFG
jgi:hypothetical protein